MGLGDVGKLRKHMTSFTLTMNKIFDELKSMSDMIDRQSKVINAMLEAMDELDKKVEEIQKYHGIEKKG
jgi:archaellum component FlaC